ncbi:hypothetical protein KC332_g6207 [Hortaea werneckii]|nr:hypothetical protein KC358_g8109 [Hortaea werneckii]KAI6830511.1 hypothetical protein KC350_g7566 [Hortaea werneckii]KAI6933886.1 hypothetical protein KC341_g7983 [Hortaea werneckii]KAI6941705.1 hypothetical protein KC348_g4650 [Hortaea werneckii]KAI6968564.1 hypothetical protein KC321_g8380 [Hortaea werneckii]
MGFSLFKKIPKGPSDKAAGGRTTETNTAPGATPRITPQATTAGHASDAISTANAQALGSVIGTFDIRCTLEGRRSKWGPKWCLEDDLQGALYFELQFASSRPHDVPLKTATVRIRFGPPDNSEPVPCVFTHAPINGISGPPMTHTQEQHSTLNPQVGINAAGLGLNFSGYERGKGMESVPARSWEFTSGKPSRVDDPACSAVDSDTSVTDVEFTWTRGWDDDYDGLNRTFRAAVIVNRDEIKDMAMTVLVEASAKHAWHQALAPKERKSRYLHPVNNTSQDAFEDLLHNLQTTVEADNHARLPQVMPSKFSVSPGPAQQSDNAPEIDPSIDLRGLEAPPISLPVQQNQQSAVPLMAPERQATTPVMVPAANSASSTISPHNRPRSGDDFADSFDFNQFNFGNPYSTSGTREFDFDWDSFMIDTAGGFDPDISDGTGVHTSACIAPSEPMKATVNGDSDEMAGKPTSHHPWPIQDAIPAGTTSELLNNAPTHLSLCDTSPKKSTSPDSSMTTSATERNRKRQRNTEAARRYRQRKVDRTTELEEALAAVSKERDELRLKLARSEAEAEVLRRMVRN